MNKKYLEAYYENEYDANRRMVFILTSTAIFLFIMLILYNVGVFSVTKSTLTIIDISFPINIIILLLPLTSLKNKYYRRPHFKNIVLIDYILVVSLLNIIIPKHAILGWAACIITANHYYNPRVGRGVFIFTIIMMFISLYLGLFFGEYDSNLLTGQMHTADGLIYNPFLEQTFPDTPFGRFEYIKAINALGFNLNRYVSIFIFYYLPRLGCLTIIFFISNALNKRTYNLLKTEIQTSVEQERTNTELNVAKDIQLETLPNSFFQNANVELQAYIKPTTEVGGDFYDYFVLDNHHIGILIGDVSGKGIGAAMFMMKTITCFENVVSINKTPAETLQEVNRKIYEGNHNTMFVTCFYAILDTKEGTLVYANAGHLPPVIGTTKHYRFLKQNPGFVLAVMENITFSNETAKMAPGDAIMFYTDGITEAKNKDGKLYGDIALINLFNRCESNNLADLNQLIKDDLFAFTKDAQQSDDITYLLLKYHGPNCFYQEKTFSGKKLTVKPMLDFLKTFKNNHVLIESFINSLCIVSDELLSNIIKYGELEKDGEITIKTFYSVDAKEFVLTIIDNGIAFNPFMVNEEPIGEDYQTKSEGGLGILIVKNIVDDYSYIRTTNKNIIILVKHL